MQIVLILYSEMLYAVAGVLDSVVLYRFTECYEFTNFIMQSGDDAAYRVERRPYNSQHNDWQHRRHSCDAAVSI